MHYNVTEGCFRMEAAGVHRQEALTRQAVCHASPLAYIVGPYGFLKEASTCRIEVFRYIDLERILRSKSDTVEEGSDGIVAGASRAKAIGMR
jgi:hypothetical protein